MKTWCNVTKEDLEFAPGVFDWEKVDQINRNTYIERIDDMVDLGINQMADIAQEQLWHMMDDILMMSMHIFEDRYPEPEEYAENRNNPDIIETVKHLLHVSTSVNNEIWPSFKEHLLSE